jgi:tRNA(Ile)-lysidine synthase
LRNRIRHELLPLLRTNYQPALSKVVLRLMEIVGHETELARLMAEERLRRARKSGPTGPKQPLSKLSVAVQRHILRIQLLRHGLSPDFELVEKLRLQPDAPVTIDELASSPRCMFRDAAGIVHWQQPGPISFNRKSRKLFIRDSRGQAKFNGLGITWQTQCKAGISLPRHKPGTEFFDAGLVGSKVILRHWRKGDRFQPIGMPVSVKLQDLFVNQKVPRVFRHKLAIAETEKGDIFWVEGLRISERFQLTKSTKRRLQWQWSRD